MSDITDLYSTSDTYSGTVPITPRSDMGSYSPDMGSSQSDWDVDTRYEEPASNGYHLCTCPMYRAASKDGNYSGYTVRQPASSDRNQLPVRHPPLMVSPSLPSSYPRQPPRSMDSYYTTVAPGQPGPPMQYSMPEDSMMPPGMAHPQHESLMGMSSDDIRRRRSTGDTLHHRNNSASTVYEFVSLPSSQQQKRPRRRYEEIERIYDCNFPGCAKAYGTLNHLNAHVTMQRHGNKRTPEEFRETRRLWKLRKKEQERAELAASSSMVSQPMLNGSHHPQSHGMHPPQSSHLHSMNSRDMVGMPGHMPMYGHSSIPPPPPPSDGSGQIPMLPPLPSSPLSTHNMSPVSNYFSRSSHSGQLPPTSMPMPMYGDQLSHSSNM